MAFPAMDQSHCTPSEAVSASEDSWVQPREHNTKQICSV